jgi:tetratricopeptide (TPR) repeat protein
MALLAIVSVVYAPVTRGVFIWDDHALIETNVVAQRGSVREIFSQPYWTSSSLSDVRVPYYRPLTMLTLRADYAMAGDEAASFHISNLLAHLLATVALVLAARRLGATPAASVLAAAAWALHPRSTEAVAWISGRTDVLAGLMAFVAIGLWPWYGAERDMRPGGDAKPARPWLDAARAALAATAILAGLLAKEVAIAAALAIAVGTAVGHGPGAARWARVLRRLAFVAVPVLVYAALRMRAVRGSSRPSLTPMGIDVRGATVVQAVGRYLESTFDPWHPATSIGLVGEVDRGSVVLGSIVLVFVVALTARAIVRARAKATAPVQGRAVMAALVALGASSLALVVHVVPITLAAGVVADRLLYLPLAALALGPAVAWSRASARTRGVMAAALAVSFVPVTRARCADYSDELKFRVVAAEDAHPGNTSPRSGLANVLRSEGETELACKLHASVKGTLERRAQTHTQRYVRALENLGACQAAIGKYEDAASSYDAVERIAPSHARVHMERGYLRLHTFDLAGSEAEFRRALELEPHLETARTTLALIPGMREQLARFDTAAERQAHPASWARVLASLGRLPDATAVWTVIAMSPNVAEPAAREAVEHVIADADLATAKRAVEAQVLRRAPHLDRTMHLLGERIERQRRIDALRARIVALASK